MANDFKRITTKDVSNSSNSTIYAVPAGADDFQFTANTFTAQTGSSIVAPEGGLTLGSTAVGSTAAELNLLDGSAKSTSSITIADTDAFIVIDGTTTKQIPASDLKTYNPGFTVSSITGATELATQPAGTDEIVLSDAGVLKRLDIKHIQNTPSFYAELSSNQSINSGSWTKVTFDSEKHDSDGTFASNRFTPAVAGTYFVTAQVAIDELADGKVAYTAIYFNGSHASGNSGTATVGGSTTSTASVNMLLTFDTDDYVEVYAYHNHGSARNAIGNSTTESGFGAFRITGF